MIIRILYIAYIHLRKMFIVYKLFTCLVMLVTGISEANY